jgi:hypothetical protein
MKATALSVCVLALWGCGGLTEARAPADDGGAETAPRDAGPDPCGSSTAGALTFSPPSGTTFDGSGSVTIVPPPGFPENGLIFYEANGSEPQCARFSVNCTGTAYVGPIQISGPGRTTIWALTAAPGRAASPLQCASYVVIPADQ